jgi:hypothetical protein
VDDAQEGIVQRFRRRVVDPVGRRRGRLVVLDVLGGDRRPHEDEVVVEVAAVQDVGGDRVEEGLRQFRLVVVDQQADVVQLGLVPDLHRQAAGAELPLQPLHRLAHPQVVEDDAVALGLLLAQPVGLLEALLRLGAALPEQPVVLVEALQQGPGHLEGLLVVQLGGKRRHVGLSRETAQPATPVLSSAR